MRPGIAEVRTGSGLVVLINQGLLSDHEAKGCPKAIVQEKDYTFMSGAERGNSFFWKLSFPLMLS
ncbi:hypothetical protein EYW98_18440 [Escherichia coli]|uniref:hypothetical protein n=1 Tax=Escherichia sp. MOD1-EC7003 TaxID=2093900 RepID=UPI000CF75650|nr:hypothetical protein [Escherichia sp. MOD1-EC7003]EGO8361352.1 hypothetical protein [Escherichia coli]EGO8378964.1 hypothetical protein [Escherichia coli]MCH0696099.1 hypothetical protein [Escherichia coli]